MRLSFIVLLVLFQFTICKAQDPVYFNNIYQKQNNFAIGMTILETDDGYIGYGGTEDGSNVGQMILLYKINKQGEEMIWKTFGENYHNYYYGNVGGAMIETNDGNFAAVCHYGYSGETFGTLIKLDNNLDTIWQKSYHPAYKTITVNSVKTNDNGFILTGWVWENENDYGNALLIKVNSNGDLQWFNTYGGEFSELGSNAIQTLDNGYLLGGFFRNPPVYHSMDAMVIKTDSLGNEQWTKYYGNPDVDDDMALVAMADDGNYLVATVYGEWVVSPTSRTGSIRLLKIDNDGTTIWDKIIGPKKRNVYLKNLRHTNDGNLIVAGWAYNDTVSEWIYEGLLYKFSQYGDSIWMRNYSHFNEQYDRNFFYDAYPTNDNGYIAIGKARPDMGTNKMWVIKVDSVGCDTPGCATGTFVRELPPIEAGNNGALRVWPNPTNSKVTLSPEFIEVSKCEPENNSRTIRIYNSQGLKIEEIKVPKQSKSIEVDASLYKSGLYYLQLISDEKVIGTTKFIKN